MIYSVGEFSTNEIAAHEVTPSATGWLRYGMTWLIPAPADPRAGFRHAASVGSVPVIGPVIGHRNPASGIRAACRREGARPAAGPARTARRRTQHRTSAAQTITVSKRPYGAEAAIARLSDGATPAAPDTFNGTGAELRKAVRLDLAITANEEHPARHVDLVVQGGLLEREEAMTLLTPVALYSVLLASG
ncbi:hypothetical protein [Streptomyces lanatus]|uniref:Uncharacterized protein n=1 Tax=Streptomyces lanatus TaxID=66900 RepID=A0ABV1Y880_9ACTN|nr:hypothetical protein [Streptomyces lanatus]GHG86471.1 hypothetical protein GCM10018780_03230 [Streptomyces lanatus]